MVMEYDDEKLASLQNMEEMAKIYYKKINEINNKKKLKINNYLLIIKNNIKYIKTFCFSRKLKEKLILINNIENKFNNIKILNNNLTNNNIGLPINYCHAVTQSIKCLCDIINQILKAPASIYEVINNVELVKTCTLLIDLFSNLIGNCKYRSYF